MSKIYTFFFCILIFTPAFSQFQHRQHRITNKKSHKPERPSKRFNPALFSPTGIDNPGQLDSLISSNEKSSFTYGTNRKVSEWLGLTNPGDSSNEDYKIIYTYNAQNFLTEEIQSTRAQGETTFTMRYRTTYTYQNNRLNEEVEYFRENNNWNESYKITFTYNGQGQVLGTKDYFKLGGNTWEEVEKSDYTYESNRLIKKEDFFLEGGTYEKYYEVRYLYNAAGKVSEEQWYNYLPDDETLPVPHYEFRDVFEYDAAGNRTSNAYYSSNSSAAPSPDNKENNGFDTRHNTSTVAVPFNDSFIVENYFTHGIVTLIQEFGWDETLSNWANQESGRIRFVYSGIQVSNKPVISAQPVKVFPSPAQSQIFVDGNLIGDYRILNINGKEMSSGKLTAQKTIQVDALPKGVYVLQVKVENASYTSRFMKD